MKRIIALLIVAAMALVSCQSGSGYYVSPLLTDASLGPDKAIEKIAVLPFGSALHSSEDPDGLAPLLMDKHFLPLLDTRKDYSFVAPQTVKFAVDREGLGGEFKQFMTRFADTNKAKDPFLTKLAALLKVDAFLIPMVDTWQQDEADRGEDSASATYVGATITIIDQKVTPGSLLFRYSVEDYIEAARTEVADRSVSSAAGIVTADRGARLFRAPPFEDVVGKVVDQLVAALPQR